MRFKICTCSEKPEEVLVLTEEEKKLFKNNSNGFLKWINKQLEVEKLTYGDIDEEIDLADAIETLKSLQKSFEDIRDNKRKKYED